MEPVKKIVDWAVMLLRHIRQPVTLREKSKVLNKTQEMARRRRQMAKHGVYYWCSIWRPPGE